MLNISIPTCLSINTSMKMQMFQNVFEAGDFISSFDLKSAYHHIMMHELEKEYLGFKWNNKDDVFKDLPFDLSTTWYIFSKVMREIVKFWRKKRF